MNNINDINQRFAELEKEFNSLEKQNKILEKQLVYEKMKNKNNSPNDIQIYLNSIKQGKIFLENSKKKNIELQKTIKDLEEQKNSLEYKLVEANQKIKRFESDYKVNDNKDNKNENNILDFFVWSNFFKSLGSNLTLFS